jgi:hypothetical protein
MARLRLDKAVGDLCKQTVRKASGDLSSAAPRVPHRARKNPARGPVGGKLAAALKRPDNLVRTDRWGAVIEWHKLGQKFLWLTQGTVRQKARPVQLAPDEKNIRAAVERESAKHYRKREKRSQRRGK